MANCILIWKPRINVTSVWYEQGLATLNSIVPLYLDRKFAEVQVAVFPQFLPY